MPEASIIGVFLFCSCAEETNRSQESLMHYGSYQFEATCKHCGKVWQLEKKPIPGGVAAYLFEKEVK